MTHAPVHRHGPDAALLLGGFEPFDGARLNPAWEVARRLDGERLPNGRVQALRLPCVFGEVAEVIDQALRRHRPAVVLLLGLAAGRPGVTLERVAVNLDDARIPDNAGQRPVDRPVVAGGPAAYFARLPLKAMAGSAQGLGCPVTLSGTAGSFVCNHAFYGLMHRLRRRPAVRGGFVHLPSMADDPDGAEAPAWPLAVQLAVVRQLLQASSADPDAPVPGAWGAIA